MGRCRRRRSEPPGMRLIAFGRKGYWIPRKSLSISEALAVPILGQDTRKCLCLQGTPKGGN
jgi:hypothetical protein